MAADQVECGDPKVVRQLTLKKRIAGFCVYWYLMLLLAGRSALYIMRIRWHALCKQE